MSDFRLIVISVEVDPLTNVEETSQTVFENLSDAENYYNDERKKDDQFRRTSIKLVRIIKRPY